MDKDRYEVQSYIESGGFCTVSKYLDKSTNKIVAVKELQQAYQSKYEDLKRFKTEIDLLQKLEKCESGGCENIIKVLDYDTKSDSPLWYSMPYAEQNLDDFISKNHDNLDAETRYELVEQVIKAIKFAHRNNILHRDISPNNIMVFEEGDKIVLKVCDFGLGRDKGSDSSRTASHVNSYGQQLYVAPEQYKKLKEATERSDIYSLGKLVYFIFTGEKPNDFKQFALSSLVKKSTQADPNDRHADISEFEKHFFSLKNLRNLSISIEYLTLKDFVSFKKQNNWNQLHELLIKGSYSTHVYHDYIKPVNDLLLKGDNLKTYYQTMGNSIRDFIKTYSDKLSNCLMQTGWPFSEMKIIGQLLNKIIQQISDEETKLESLKALWSLAYEYDQYNVQCYYVKDVFISKHISQDIEIQLKEYILSLQYHPKCEIDINNFDNKQLPISIRSAIMEVNKRKELT